MDRDRREITFRCLHLTASAFQGELKPDGLTVQDAPLSSSCQDGSNELLLSLYAEQEFSIKPF